MSRQHFMSILGDLKVDDSSGQGAYAFGPFVIDPLKRRLWRERGLVPISSKTFDVLVTLLDIATTASAKMSC